MRPRQTLIERFSTFLQFEADHFQNWVIEPQLRRSIRNCRDQLPETEVSENYWALYWHKVWQVQPDSLAREHLAAYVQEVCYWVAQKTTESFAMTQYGLADCFQMAIARLDRVLKGFNPDLGGNFKNYASATLGSLIRESLRQRREIDICSDWALLRKLSQKRLTEAFQNEGLSNSTIASYLLAWQCFKTLYAPKKATGTRKLPKPDPQTWAAITQLYNRERHAQLDFESPSANPDQIEKWMERCARAARTYLYPNFVSINTPKSDQDSGDFLDNLPDSTQTSLLNQMIDVEEARTRETQKEQLSSVLSEAIVQLNPQAQTILQLYYQARLTQQQIADQMSIKQYTVSRRLVKVRETLLRKVAEWSQKTLHISPSSDVLKYTGPILEEWLEAYYGRHEPLSPENVSAE
ncbi:MAG: sigma-70 family RNA polymerase sigma factor [Leptolyngbyaceae cyanobacterium MO_188.B28]|nr:sigma-70 family RNA polymerase sigma factor [Leptolyngbyaceae cyanobacterium MO_188.B28]